MRDFLALTKIQDYFNAAPISGCPRANQRFLVAGVCKQTEWYYPLLFPPGKPVQILRILNPISHSQETDQVSLKPMGMSDRVG